MAPCPRVRSHEGSTEGGCKGQGAFWRRRGVRRTWNAPCARADLSAGPTAASVRSPRRGRTTASAGSSQATVSDKRHGWGDAEALHRRIPAGVSVSCSSAFRRPRRAPPGPCCAQRDDPADHRAAVPHRVDADHEGPVDLDAAHAEAPDRQSEACPTPKSSRSSRCPGCAGRRASPGRHRRARRRPPIPAPRRSAARARSRPRRGPMRSVLRSRGCAAPVAGVHETVIPRGPAWSHAFSASHRLLPDLRAEFLHAPRMFHRPEKPDRSQQPKFGMRPARQRLEPVTVPVRASICGWNHARMAWEASAPVRHRTSAEFRFGSRRPPRMRPDGAWAGDLRLPQCLGRSRPGSRSAAALGRSEVQRGRPQAVSLKRVSPCTKGAASPMRSRSAMASRDRQARRGDRMQHDAEPARPGPRPDRRRAARTAGAGRHS
jgi:hypothetical protein